MISVVISRLRQYIATMLANLLGYLMTYSMIISCLTAGDLTFVKTLQEVTTRPDVELVEVSFEFENTSDKTVTIVEYDAPCACMEARMIRADKSNSLVFKPGEKGSIVGLLDFGTFSGTIDKVIRIRTNNDPVKKPSIVLTSRVTIPKLIKADKETLKWQVGDALGKKTFVIKVSEESSTPINIVSDKHGFGTDEVFSYHIETVKKGSEYKVTVEPKKTDVPAMGVVKFYTDSKIARYKLVQVFLLVDHPEK